MDGVRSNSRYFYFMDFVNINGKILPREERLNDPPQQGEGLIETMKVVDGKVFLEGFHFERLLNGFPVLKFPVTQFNLSEKFSAEITELCKKNHCEVSARARLSVHR